MFSSGLCTVYKNELGKIGRTIHFHENQIMKAWISFVKMCQRFKQNYHKTYSALPN